MQLIPVDTSLVPGLVLPRIDGLPGAGSAGISRRDLPPPPALDSPLARAELDLVRGAQLLRTPEADAWAVRMAQDGQFKLWSDLAAKHRQSTGRIQGWLDTAFLAVTLTANVVDTKFAKQTYDRLRPFQVDPSIKPPVRLPHDTSYPSGHTSAAYAAARVISVLAPELAQEAYSLARQVAVSRVYAGVHFPSDVVAGALLGTRNGDEALRISGRRPGAAAEQFA